MYGIFTYISPKNGPNVGKYTIHGAYGYGYITYGSYLVGGLEPWNFMTSISYMGCHPSH
jgi:hypothetical protein